MGPDPEPFIISVRFTHPTLLLKLTVENHFSENNLSDSQKEVLPTLRKEAKVNHFELRIS